jgi:hypothetical protein
MFFVIPLLIDCAISVERSTAQCATPLDQAATIQEKAVSTNAGLTGERRAEAAQFSDSRRLPARLQDLCCAPRPQA